MKSGGRQFLLDANVLITAHRSYYAFDLCPGFWASVLDGYGAKRVFSTLRVEGELLVGGDALTAWTKAKLPAGFFLDDTTAAIAAQYTPIMTWVAGRDFLAAAKAKYASGTDGWLIAAAKQGNYCLVTHETRKIGAKARVPIPNVCDEFGISYCSTFEMLRELECCYK